jgi:hypothetical protein
MLMLGLVQGREQWRASAGPLAEKLGAAGVDKGRSRYRIRRHLDVKQPVDPGDAGAGDGG